jgi:hypothetical protein
MNAPASEIVGLCALGPLRTRALAEKLRRFA